MPVTSPSLSTYVLTVNRTESFLLATETRPAPFVPRDVQFIDVPSQLQAVFFLLITPLDRATEYVHRNVSTGLCKKRETSAQKKGVACRDRSRAPARLTETNSRNSPRKRGIRIPGEFLRTFRNSSACTTTTKSAKQRRRDLTNVLLLSLGSSILLPRGLSRFPLTSQLSATILIGPGKSNSTDAFPHERWTFRVPFLSLLLAEKH